MSTFLTIKDLKEVYKVTFDAHSKWENVLLALGLDISAIVKIGCKWNGQSDAYSVDCYRDGLIIWLQTGKGNRSWKDLGEALRIDSVGFKEISRKIEREHPYHGPPTQGASYPPLMCIGELVIFTNERLGNGRFGTVFKGSYKGEECAVKLLHTADMQINSNLIVSQSPDSIDNGFDYECESLKSFQHTNIVKYLSTEKHPTTGNTILVIEKMDCNLREFLCNLMSDKPLSVECQLSLCTDMASGLKYIHSKHILHRDLCGDNILLKLIQPIPLAKISDFCMSRLADTATGSLTAMGHDTGYMPPEAYRLDQEQYDYSLDVFSLGVIMIQIVNKLETVKNASDRAFFLAQIPITHVLKPLINKCLQDERLNRPSANKLYEELQEKFSSVQSKAQFLQEMLETDPIYLNNLFFIGPRKVGKTITRLRLCNEVVNLSQLLSQLPDRSLLTRQVVMCIEEEQNKLTTWKTADDCLHIREPLPSKLSLSLSGVAKQHLQKQ